MVLNLQGCKYIYISNFRSGKSTKYDGNSWILTDSSKVIEDLYEKNTEEVTEMYDDLTDKKKIIDKLKKIMIIF